MNATVDLSQHQVSTLVVTCVDFRFRELFAEWIAERLGFADLIAMPGASQAVLEIPAVVQQIKRMVSLHHVERVVVADHIDCGAYGGSKKFGGDLSAEVGMHQEQLEKARALLLREVPGVEVSVYLIGPEGEVAI